MPLRRQISGRGSSGRGSSGKNNICNQFSKFVTDFISNESSISLRTDIMQFQEKWNHIITNEAMPILEERKEKTKKLDEILTNIEANFKVEEEKNTRQRQAVILYIYGDEKIRKKLYELTSSPITPKKKMMLENISDDIIDKSAQNLKPCKTKLSYAPVAGGGFTNKRKTKKKKTKRKTKKKNLNNKLK